MDFGTIVGLLGGGLGARLAERGYGKLEDIGKKGYEGLTGLDPNTGEILRDAEGRPTGLAQQLEERLEFQPYTVTSATGGQFGMMQDPETGEMTYNLQTSVPEQALQQAQLERAGMFFGQAATPTAQR